MIKVCGIIIIIFPFSMPIIASIPAGSVMGFAGGSVLDRESFEMRKNYMVTGFRNGAFLKDPNNRGPREIRRE
jgi:hypothetical protein